MKKIFLYTVLFATLATGSCKKFLDINTDEDTPQDPDPTSVFPTQLSGIPRGTQYDARYIARYIQNWLTGNNANNNAWDLHSYVGASDNSGDIWRQCYYGLGKNLVYVIEQGEKQQRWDVAGAGLAIQALMFQMTTDYHGEIGFYDLFKDDQVFYKYTGQDTVYRGVDSIAKKAIDYLSRTIENTGKPPLSRGDFSFNGDVAKWKKVAWGVRARNWHHLTNKATYNADSVIYFCNQSMSAQDGTDDFLVPFTASKNDDANFFGTYRNNMSETVSSVVYPMRQSNFIVRLLDGTTFLNNATTGWTRDPRLRHMLGASADTTGGNGGYRGVTPGSGDPNAAVTTTAGIRRRVPTLWGDSTLSNPSTGSFTTGVGKYLFKDKAVHPVMTYSEIQFIKAEAAFRKGDKTTALAAYRNGVRGHMRFINRDVYPLQNVVLYNSTKITDAEMNFYMDQSGAIKTTEAALTISDIMLQKYIALWAWGFVETWVDLRRFHYMLDIDPATGTSVYKNFTLPSIAAANNGLLVQRVRPRYNSEYVWNIGELQRIGALSNTYHTKPMWFSEP